MTLRYCRRCRKRVKAEWVWAHPHPVLLLLAILSLGLLLPILLVASERSRYVCPHCLENV